MKKIWLFSTLAAVVALSAGCSKNEPADAPEVKGGMRNIELMTSVEPDAPRAQWVDGEGISWEESDAERMGFVSSIGDVYHSTSMSVEEETGKASFGIAIGASADKIFTYYPYRDGALAYTPDKGTFTITYKIDAAQAQAVAGICSMSSMPMMSAGVVEAGEGFAERNNPMSLVGSLVRFLIFTDDEEYAAENVLSAAITASEGTMMNGTCVLTGGWETEIAAGAAVGGTNTAKVTLQSDYILADIKDANSAKGVYLIVAPAVSDGCTYVVKTDKAEYTFVSTAEKTFAANTIHNIVLNLAKATERKENGGEVVHTVAWNKELDFNIPASKWQGEYGATTVTFDEVPVADMENVVFDIVDTEDNPIMWLKAEWVNTNDYNVRFIAERHPDNTDWRRGRIYIKYNGLRSTTCVQINQEPGNGIPFIVPALTQVYDAEIAAAGETVEKAATLSLEVNGEKVSDVAPYVQYVKLTCGAAAATVDGADIKIVFPENTSATKKNYTLKVSTDDGEASIRFTQAEGEGGGDETPKMGYNLQKLPGYEDGARWGVGAGTTDMGRFFRVYDVKDADGKAFSIPLELDEDTLAQLMSQIFVLGDVEEGDKVAGDGATDDKSFVTFYPALQQGDSIYVDFHLTANTTGQRRYAKIIVNDAEGNPLYTWVIWQDA